MHDTCQPMHDIVAARDDQVEEMIGGRHAWAIPHLGRKRGIRIAALPCLFSPLYHALYTLLELYNKRC